MKVKDHYDKHLAGFYSWMIGNFNVKQSEQEAFFRDHGIEPFKTKIAFDLGAGHGLQAISLANIGFLVKAVDFNKQLLGELSNNKKSLSIEIINADFFDFLREENSKADVITCMGDTITHLVSLEDVEKLIQQSSGQLVDKGKIIFSFRDLTNELKHEERFILVKQDSDRILTCYLEYFPNHVMVHDIFYEKKNDQWLQQVSAYPKLRLSGDIIKDFLIRNRYSILFEKTINRMIYIVGEKI